MHQGSFKFIHSADIHLDSPLKGLDRYEGAPADRIRIATRVAFEAMIDMALREEVAFVIIAGDLYDGDWRDYSTGMFFARQMARLGEVGIPAFVVYGNHDAHSEITHALRLPPNVHAFPADHADTHTLGDLQVALHGRSYGRRAETDDLSLTYPGPVEGCFNIGLLHTCVDQGHSGGHAPYAPCSIKALAEWGYDYWALGHVHAHSVLHTTPHIVFSGNLQGRHARETGPKGCVMVTVSGGRVTEIEHRPLDVVRWHHLRIDATDRDTPEQLLHAIEEALDAAIERDERLHAVRLTLEGACRAHQALVTAPEHWLHEIRALALGLYGHRVWLEKVQFHTRMVLDVEQALSRDDALGALLRAVSGDDEDSHSAQAVLEAARDELMKLQYKINAEFGGDFERVDLLRSDLVEQARSALLVRLLQLGEPI
ncbi:MAG: exonuclease SbcCD subunit D [Bradymonadia bacterium]